MKIRKTANPLVHGAEISDAYKSSKLELFIVRFRLAIQARFAFTLSKDRNSH